MHGSAERFQLLRPAKLHIRLTKQLLPVFPLAATLAYSPTAINTAQRVLS